MCGVVSVLLSQGLSSSSQLNPSLLPWRLAGKDSSQSRAGEAAPAWGQGDGAEQQDQWNNYLGLPGVNRALG